MGSFLKPSNHCLRPSKTFQFDKLEKELKKIKGRIGIDAAAESMKNRRMFNTEKYFGIEINLSLLKRGIETHDSTTTFGILGDLTKLEKLPDGSANVVVSTNTLYLITGQNKIKALEHLCRIVAPDGEFICDAPIGQELEETLAAVKKNFKDVKVIYFVNIFSRAYEKIFEKNGYLGSHPIAGSRPFLALSWLISRLEYITQTIKSLNTCALIICAKKISDKKNNFDVSNLPLISHNIYNLLE